MARELGCTVKELLARTDSAELTEWMAFFNLENQERETREADLKENLKRPVQNKNQSVDEKILAWAKRYSGG